MNAVLDIEHFRRRLLEERKRVVGAIDNLHSENPGSIADETDEPTFQDNHLGDIATVTFDREMATTLEDNATHVLAEINAALARIDADTYGLCERCGEPIGAERLEALPWATLCIDDKRKQERA
jgi:RNA polymerase-binding protein DksA